jgi:hypothetical protein
MSHTGGIAVTQRGNAGDLPDKQIHWSMLGTMEGT